MAKKKSYVNPYKPQTAYGSNNGKGGYSKPQKTTFGKVIKVLGIIAIIYTVFSLCITMVPSFSGKTAVTISSDSMEPAIKENSIVYFDSKASYGDLKEDDIIIYYYDPKECQGVYGNEEQQITTRILSVKEDGLEVKADNVKEKDPYLVTADMYLGKATNAILQGGATIFNFFTGMAFRFVIIAIIGVWLVYDFRTKK